MLKTNPTQGIHSGDRVRVTQVLVAGGKQWRSQVEGIVESTDPEWTESWFAHGKKTRYWLHRIRLLKDDGERTCLTLDQNSRLEKLS